MRTSLLQPCSRWKALVNAEAFPKKLLLSGPVFSAVFFSGDPVFPPAAAPYSPLLARSHFVPQNSGEVQFYFHDSLACPLFPFPPRTSSFSCWMRFPFSLTHFFLSELDPSMASMFCTFYSGHSRGAAGWLSSYLARSSVVVWWAVPSVEQLPCRVLGLLQALISVFSLFSPASSSELYRLAPSLYRPVIILSN